MKLAPVIAAIAAIAGTASAGPAGDLFAEGQAAYDRGDYGVAIEKWQASYQMSGQDQLLFDVAQARRLAGDCRGAVSSYRHFVEVDPTSPQRSLAEDLARELEARCGEQVVAPPKEPVVAPPPPLPIVIVTRVPRIRSSGRRLKITGLAAGGAGLVAIAAGVGLGHHAAVIGAEVTAACRTSCYWSAERSADSAGRRDAAIGYVVDGLGAATVVGGAIAYYLGLREGAIETRDGGAVVSLRGSW